MKGKAAAWLAPLALALGLTAAAASATTVRVTVIDRQWDVGTIEGSLNDLASTLEKQVWWGNWMLAGAFAKTVGGKLGGLPEQPHGPLFAFQSTREGSLYSRYSDGSSAIVWSYFSLYQPNARFTFAMAKPAPAPVPIPLGGLLLLAGLTLCRVQRSVSFSSIRRFWARASGLSPAATG